MTASSLQIAHVDKSELPEGWAFSILDKVGYWGSGGTPSRKIPTHFGGRIPWVKSGDLPDGIIDEVEETLSDEGLKHSAAKLLPVGTVIVALYGATIGKLGILGIEAATNQACAHCRVNESLTLKEFLFYYLLQQRDELVAEGQGGAQPNLTNRIVRDWPICLPPLAEQVRIVKKIEQLLTRVIATRERLTRVPIILKRFRQSILTAACSGRLTEEWREKHSGTESVEALISKINHFRMGIAQGPHAVDSVGRLEELDEIPRSWRWVQFGSVIGELRNGISTKPGQRPPGNPILRISSVRSGAVLLNEIRYLPNSDELIGVYRLRDYDLLFTRYNGSLDLLGVCGMVRNLGEKILLYPDKLMRVRIDHPYLLPAYAEYFFQTPNSRDRMTAKSKSSAGQQGISGADVKAQPIALPPLEEQHEIIRRVETLFKLADAIEKRVAATTTRAHKLTQAILAKAFRGELVPTEAELARREGRSYEPASALLARIGAESAGNGSPHKPLRNRK
jgi:type I restriction enzyme S subunit